MLTSTWATNFDPCIETVELVLNYQNKGVDISLFGRIFKGEGVTFNQQLETGFNLLRSQLL